MHLNALGLGKAWQYCQQHPITIPFWFWNVNLYQASYVRNNRYKSVAQLASGNLLRQLNLEKQTATTTTKI